MNKDKKYNIILGLMIFFFVIIVGIAIAFGLGYIGINKNTNSNLQTNTLTNENSSTNTNNSNVTDETTKTEIDNVTNKTQTTTSNKMTTEQKKQLLKTLINVNEDKGKCQLGDCDLHLKANLPKINLNTPTVTTINAKIESIYTAVEDYYKQDFSQKQGQTGKFISYEITSKSGYIASLDCIYISVVNQVIHSHASGYSQYHTYIYQVDNDKELTLKELLDSQGITKSDLERKFKATPEYKTYLKDTLIDYSKIFLEDINENSISLGLYVNIMYSPIITFNF